MSYIYDELTTFAVKGQVEYCGLDGYEVIRVKKYNGNLEFTYKEGSIFLKETPKRKFKITVIVKKKNN